MNIETRNIRVGALSVEVVRKNIKNLHLGVYPPHGRVRVYSSEARFPGHLCQTRQLLCGCSSWYLLKL